MSLFRTWVPVVVVGVLAVGYFVIDQHWSGGDDQVRTYRGGDLEAQRRPESDGAVRIYRGGKLKAERGGDMVVVQFRLCDYSSRSNCVVDGDTIRYDGDKIRIADIDTPEIFSPGCNEERALGQRATARLVELLNAGAFEVVRSGGRDKDRYGRKLRVIERDGQSLGAVLVAEGLARRWDGAVRDRVVGDRREPRRPFGFAGRLDRSGS